MEYQHATYENTRESTDKVLRYSVAHLTRNGINDIHQAVARYNALVNLNKEGREDAREFIRCASCAWTATLLPDGEISAWSIEDYGWRTVTAFTKPTKRYKGPSEAVPYSTRKLY